MTPRREWPAGHYAHRYRRGTGFRNRSVYCADLARIITHVRSRVTTDLQRLTDRAGQPRGSPPRDRRTGRISN